MIATILITDPEPECPREESLLRRLTRKIKRAWRMILALILAVLGMIGGLTFVNVENIENVWFGWPRADPERRTPSANSNDSAQNLPLAENDLPRGSESIDQNRTRESDLEEENAELRARESELEEENAELRARESELEEENAELRARESELEEENAGFQGQLEVVLDESASQQREIANLERLLRRGPCQHNMTFQPPRLLSEDAQCTIEDPQMLPAAKYDNDSVVYRQLRFYGVRSPITVNATNILAVVPPFTHLYTYRWDLSECPNGSHTGGLEQPVLEFRVSDAGTCIVRLSTWPIGQFPTPSKPLTYTVR